MRPVPRAARHAVGGLAPGALAVRHAPGDAARTLAVFRGRADARSRGELQLRRLQAEQDVRQWGLLQRLPRSALRHAPWSDRQRLRPVPRGGIDTKPSSTVATRGRSRPSAARRATCPSGHTWSSTNAMITGFRVPRPDLSAKLGLPNACNDCHRDRSAEWAADAVERWFGPKREGFQTYAEPSTRPGRRSPAGRSASPRWRRIRPFPPSSGPVP